MKMDKLKGRAEYLWKGISMWRAGEVDMAGDVPTTVSLGYKPSAVAVKA